MQKKRNKKLSFNNLSASIQKYKQRVKFKPVIMRELSSGNITPGRKKTETYPEGTLEMTRVRNTGQTDKDKMEDKDFIHAH